MSIVHVLNFSKIFADIAKKLGLKKSNVHPLDHFNHVQGPTSYWSVYSYKLRFKELNRIKFEKESFSAKAWR